MDDYGKQVFSDSFYLMPRIYFTRLNSAIRTASIDYKLYNPRLDLCTTPDSSLGYTMSEQIDLLDSPTQVFGFGSDTQGFLQLVLGLPNFMRMDNYFIIQIY